jgi:hypothetical protein
MSLTLNLWVMRWEDVINDSWGRLEYCSQWTKNNKTQNLNIQKLRFPIRHDKIVVQVK